MIKKHSFSHGPDTMAWKSPFPRVAADGLQRTSFQQIVGDQKLHSEPHGGCSTPPCRKVSFLMPLQAEAAWRACIHPRACLDPGVASSLHVGGWLGLLLSCMPCLPCRPFGCGRRRLSFGCTSFAPSVTPQIVIMGGPPYRALNKETCCWLGREGVKIMSAPLVRFSSCALPTGGRPGAGLE